MTANSDQRKRTVFIVDDHPLVREWLTNLINQQPDLVVCGESESAPEAFAAFGASKPDIAIVDISLKNSSGIELIKNLKESHPAVAVLVLSMHEESHYAGRALRAGARGYVMKRETTARSSKPSAAFWRANFTSAKTWPACSPLILYMTIRGPTVPPSSN